MKNASLEKAFREIKKQTGYEFLYTDEMLEKAKPVFIEAKNATIEDVLNQCFKDQPLNYEVIEKTIVVKPNNPSTRSGLLNDAAASPPPIDITGRITNAQGEPLAGASVIVKRTSKGDIADANGNFKLHNVNTDDVIEISYTGYKKQAIKVGDRTNFTLILEVAVDELDRAVVQAYGKTTQRFATGNIGKVTAEEITRQPVQNPLMALQGKVPGLDIVPTSGYASAPLIVELRGRTVLSTTLHSDPLYIIDGVPLNIVGLNDGYYISGSPGFIQNGFPGPAEGQSPLYSINPSDIESIEVLKDADATAIYGSRAANGVVLITTKTGKAGKTKFDASVKEGVTMVTNRRYKLLNTQQYLEMRNEAIRNDGLTVDPVLDYDINGTWDTTRYTDWQKENIGKMGKSLTAGINLTGGNAQTIFRIGGAYDRVTDITSWSGANERAFVSTNIQHRSLNQKLRMALTSNYSNVKTDMRTLPYSSTIAPDAPAIFDSTGQLNWSGWGGPGNNSDARGLLNFFNTIFQPYSSKTNFLNAALDVNYTIIKGLQGSLNFGYNNAQVTQNQIFPIAAQDPNQNPTGSSQWGYNSNHNWIIEPQLDYTTFVHKGKLNILAGSSIQQTSTEGVAISGTGYTSDNLLGSLSFAPKVTSSQYNGQYKYAAVFARINYNWENKYIINFNGRRDGSSRFGPGKQYGNFGSVGAAWIFTEENWFKKHIPLLSFGKIRGSYGTTGSDGIGDYKYFSQYSSVNTFPYGGVTPLRPSVEGNPDYHWQVNKKLELAFDGGLFKDRVNFGVSWYRDRSGNQLIDLSLPLLTGFPSVVANSVAEIENSGWEFMAQLKVLDTKNFSLSLNFNLSSNRNKLLSYPDLELSPFASRYVIGKTLNLQRVLHYTGVDPLTGQPSFEDKNHDGQIKKDYTARTIDDTYPIDLNPKYYGGFGADFSFKGLQLNLFFSYKKQIGQNALLQGALPGTLNANMPVEVLNRWQQPGDNKPYAMFTTGVNASAAYGNFLGQSDGVYTDASFIRLSNAALSYTIPTSVLKKSGLKGCSIFINTNNLFTITNYLGLDPETQDYTAFPPTRTIVGGLSLNF